MAHPSRDRAPVQDSVPHRAHHPARLLTAAPTADKDSCRSRAHPPSTRIAALVILIYGIHVRRISELTLDDVEATAEQTTIRIGHLPAPIPEALLPYFHQHLADRGNRQTMNHRTQWLFPGTRAGHHISEQALMQRLRGLGIDIQAARNAARHDLTKEIDPASLADLLGYSIQVMNIHAARAAVPMANLSRAQAAHEIGRSPNVDPTDFGIAVSR